LPWYNLCASSSSGGGGTEEDMTLPISVNGIPLAALLSSCIDTPDAHHRNFEVIRSIHCSRA
jgi:orotate phosphoribosyltransferase-like protein